MNAILRVSTKIKNNTNLSDHDRAEMEYIASREREWYVLLYGSSAGNCCSRSLRIRKEAFQSLYHLFKYQLSRYFYYLDPVFAVLFCDASATLWPASKSLCAQLKAEGDSYKRHTLLGVSC